PVFDPEGTTTAGNAPGVNDGAGCVIVTSEEFARRCGVEVLATIVSQAYVADDFAYLARTPAKAGARALEKAGKTIDDVELVELDVLRAPHEGLIEPPSDDLEALDRLRRRIESSGRFCDGRLDLGIEADGELIGSIEARRPPAALPPGVFELGITLFAAH